MSGASGTSRTGDTNACAAPLTNEQLVAYWANDVDTAQADAIEEHLFACGVCQAAAERVAQIAEAFRSQLPPVISTTDLAKLHTQGATIVENTFAPGTRQPVVFGRGVDLLIHRLGGLDLASAERVQVTVRNESGEQVIIEEMFAPFDRERGEILIACQRHFAVYPPDIVVDVRIHRADAAPPVLATYIIPHAFAP